MSDPNVPPPPGGGAPPPPPPPGGYGGGAPPPPPPPGGYGGGGGAGAPPPGQPYGGGGVPRLDVGEAVSYGWNKFQQYAKEFILLVLAAVVIIAVVQIIQVAVSRTAGGIAALILSIVLSVAAFVIGFMVQAGVFRAALAVTRGEAPSFSMFTDTTNLGPYILTVLLVGLGALVGFVLCIIPGIIWLIFTAYAPLLSLDKGMGPGDAISTSLNWVKENLGQVFVILLVAYLIYIVGFLICLVGATRLDPGRARRHRVQLPGAQQRAGRALADGSKRSDL